MPAHRDAKLLPEKHELVHHEILETAYHDHLICLECSFCLFLVFIFIRFSCMMETLTLDVEPIEGASCDMFFL